MWESIEAVVRGKVIVNEALNEREKNHERSIKVNKQIIKLGQKQFGVNDKPGKVVGHSVAGCTGIKSVFKIKSS